MDKNAISHSIANMVVNVVFFVEGAAFFRVMESAGEGLVSVEGGLGFYEAGDGETGSRVITLSLVVRLFADGKTRLA